MCVVSTVIYYGLDGRSSIPGINIGQDFSFHHGVMMSVGTRYSPRPKRELPLNNIFQVVILLRVGVFFPTSLGMFLVMAEVQQMEIVNKMHIFRQYILFSFLLILSLSTRSFDFSYVSFNSHSLFSGPDISPFKTCPKSVRISSLY
jgi:hypothetical protein